MQRSTNITHSCRQEPKDYRYGPITIPNANQVVAGLGQILDQDATFLLKEIVGLPTTVNQSYRFQVFDPALMPLQDSPIDPYYQVFDPPVRYPPGGKIIVTAEDTSGLADTQVQLLFRGVNQYVTYREEPEDEGPVLEVPRTHYLEIQGVAEVLQGGQTVDLDLDADFELRQVLPALGSTEDGFLFFNRDRAEVINGTGNWPGQGIYDPGIRYRKGEKIIVNLSSNEGDLTIIQFVGVNRHRV